MLAGKLEADNAQQIPQLSVSLKPQMIAPKFPGTVRMLLIKQIKASFMHPQFNSDVIKPMQMEDLLDQDVKTLSGGELQRVAIVLALGKPADVYLLDEPSSHLDVEQRVNAAKVIKRLVEFRFLSPAVVLHTRILTISIALSRPCGIQIHHALT
jgi:ATP-binding cassette subfamily E protein 1